LRAVAAALLAAVARCEGDGRRDMCFPLECASHPPSQRYGVAGSEPTTDMSILPKFLAQVLLATEARRAMKRAFVGSGLIVALLFAIALSASPQLHARLHPDANRGNHECAVTLIASGNYDHATPTPVVVPPSPAVQFSTIPALTPQWVEPLFLGACIFEHAPPARA